MKAHDTFHRGYGEAARGPEHNSTGSAESSGPLKLLEKEESSKVRKERTLDQYNDQAVGMRTRQSSDACISDGQSRRPQQSRRSKQKGIDFKVYEDGTEARSYRPSTSSALPFSHDTDPPKENFEERGDLQRDTVAEQLFQDLSNATQRQHSTLASRSGTTAVPANETPERPPPAAFSDYLLPEESSMVAGSQERNGSVSYDDGTSPSPRADNHQGQHMEIDSSVCDAKTDERKSLRSTASDFF